MQIVLTRISQEEHSVRVHRNDGSSEEVILNSRSFLRHDLAHLAVEMEVPFTSGFWGCVARGASLSGEGVTGKEITAAERLAGPVQTLMRLEADVDRYEEVLKQLQPGIASRDLAARIHERTRQLQGHWRATPYGQQMIVEWAE